MATKHNQFIMSNPWAMSLCKPLDQIPLIYVLVNKPVLCLYIHFNVLRQAID